MWHGYRLRKLQSIHSNRIEELKTDFMTTDMKKTAMSAEILSDARYFVNQRIRHVIPEQK